MRTVAGLSLPLSLPHPSLPSSLLSSVPRWPWHCVLQDSLYYPRVALLPRRSTWQGPGPRAAPAPLLPARGVRLSEVRLPSASFFSIIKQEDTDAPATVNTGRIRAPGEAFRIVAWSEGHRGGRCPVQAEARRRGPVAPHRHGHSAGKMEFPSKQKRMIH